MSAEYVKVTPQTIHSRYARPSFSGLVDSAAPGDDPSPPASVGSLAAFSRAGGAAQSSFVSEPLPFTPPSPLRPHRVHEPVSGYVRSEPTMASSVRDPLLPRSNAVSNKSNVGFRRSDAILDDEAAPAASLVRPWRFSPRTVVWTLLMCFVDAIMFIVATAYDTEFEALSINPFVGPPLDALIVMGAKDTPLMIGDGATGGWRLITSVFLHAGIIHLAFSVVFKLVAGFALERRIGWWRTAVLYLFSGLGGTLISALFLPEKSTVSGSAPLFGLTAGLIAELCTYGVQAREKPLRFIALLVASNLLMLVSGIMPLVDNFAHIGALLFGFSVAMAVLSTTPLVVQLKRRRALLAGIGGSICALILLVTGFVLLYVLRVDSEWCTFCHTVSCLPVAQWQCATSATM
jgi:membrane associated rhomboid family serine protease